MIYSIWEDEGNSTLVEGTDPPTFYDGSLITKKSILREIFIASSWNEAVKIYDQWRNG